MITAPPAMMSGIVVEGETSATEVLDIHFINRAT